MDCRTTGGLERNGATVDAAAGPGGAPTQAFLEPPVLRVEKLSFCYARADVWSDVSFSIDSGKVAFLTGPNGSGKSTLFRCLAGWAAPSQGTVELFGKPFDGSDRMVRRQMAFVPDVPSFYDDLTAVEHIRFVLAANRVPAGEDEALRLFDRLGLAAHGDQYPSSYSRGMRLKLALVLALMAKPRLLLLDEPYGPLDREAAAALSSLLADARDDGAAVLMSCHHDVPDLEPDVQLRLDGGRLVPGRSTPDGATPGGALAQPGALIA
ncbi:ABC transporter ATP-binding protein [Enteroscipio rubneri]|uniref:ABC transporter ATP-binding protein n=1 Tax=Enteroscipio rubneri TaxID=2070686 RepID=UPI003208E6FA